MFPIYLLELRMLSGCEQQPLGYLAFQTPIACQCDVESHSQACPPKEGSGSSFVRWIWFD